MNRFTNTFRYSALMFLFTGALMACNNDEQPLVGGGTDVDPETNIPGLKADELGLYAYNGGIQVETNVWSEKMTMGLFLTKDSVGNVYENDSSTYNNIKCTFTNEGWVTKPEKIKLTDRPAVIYAYAPYIEDVDPMNVPVECASGEFYMYGTHLEPQTSVRIGENIAKIMMKQVQALVDFRIRKKDWDGEIKLQSIIIRRKGYDQLLNDTVPFTADSINALPIAGIYNIQNGKLVNTEWGQHEKFRINAVVTDDFTTSARALLTVMPLQFGKDEVEVAFMVNDMWFSFMLRQDKDWEAGTHNIINLTFTGEGFEVEELIKPWVDIEQDIIVNT